MGAEGKTTVLSPRTNGDADPIAEWGTSLWNEGTDGSKEAAKRFWPKMRIFAPIVVRGEEDKGVRWWGFSRTTYQALLDVVLDPEYGDITDPQSGTDLVLTYGKPSGASFPQTKLTPRRRSSPLCDEAVGGDERCTELLDNIPDFDALFERKTTSDVSAMLDEYLSGDQSAETSSSETEKYTATTTTNDPVDAAFDELMGA